MFARFHETKVKMVAIVEFHMFDKTQHFSNSLTVARAFESKILGMCHFNEYTSVRVIIPYICHILAVFVYVVHTKKKCQNTKKNKLMHF